MKPSSDCIGCIFSSFNIIGLLLNPKCSRRYWHEPDKIRAFQQLKADRISRYRVLNVSNVTRIFPTCVSTQLRDKKMFKILSSWHLVSTCMTAPGNLPRFVVILRDSNLVRHTVQSLKLYMHPPNSHRLSYSTNKQGAPFPEAHCHKGPLTALSSQKPPLIWLRSQLQRLGAGN